MNILVTGAGGFIGQNLVTYLLKHGYYVIANHRRYFADELLKKWSEYGKYRACYCDLQNKLSLRGLLSQDIDTVIHLAGHARPEPNGTLSNMMLDNAYATHHLVESLSPNKRVIFASSVVIYDSFPSCEIDEVKPISIYGATKVYGEQVIDYYTQTGHIRGTSLRMCATVGPNLTHGLIKDICHKLQNEDKLELFGTSPGSIKPYLHIDDLCSAIELMINNNRTGSYNVCPFDNISVKSVAELCMTKFGAKKIVWNPDKTWIGDNNKILCNNTLIRTIGWNPQYLTSEQAILDILNYV